MDPLRRQVAEVEVKVPEEVVETDREVLVVLRLLIIIPIILLVVVEKDHHPIITIPIMGEEEAEDLLHHPTIMGVVLGEDIHGTILMDDGVRITEAATVLLLPEVLLLILIILLIIIIIDDEEEVVVATAAEAGVEKTKIPLDVPLVGSIVLLRIIMAVVGVAVDRDLFLAEVGAVLPVVVAVAVTVVVRLGPSHDLLLFHPTTTTIMMDRDPRVKNAVTAAPPTAVIVIVAKNIVIVDETVDHDHCRRRQDRPCHRRRPPAHQDRPVLIRMIVIITRRPTTTMVREVMVVLPLIKIPGRSLSINWLCEPEAKIFEIIFAKR